MASYYNRTRQSLTIQLTSGQDLTIPSKSWISISPEHDGSASIIENIHKGLLVKSTIGAPITIEPVPGLDLEAIAAIFARAFVSELQKSGLAFPTSFDKYIPELDIEAHPTPPILSSDQQLPKYTSDIDESIVDAGVSTVGIEKGHQEQLVEAQVKKDDLASALSKLKRLKNNE